MYLNLTHLIKAYRSKHLNFLIINLFKQIAFAQKDLPFTSYCLYNFPQPFVLLQSLTSQRHYIDNSVHNMKTNASDFFSLFFFSFLFFSFFLVKRASDTGYKNTHSFGVQEIYDIDLSFTFFQPVLYAWYFEFKLLFLLAVNENNEIKECI